MVVPEFQGRGIAIAVTAQAIELAKHDDKHRFMHAFPNIDNAPSNAICRKLGFELLEVGASGQCARGACTRASSRVAAGLPPIPPGFGECGVLGSSPAWHPRPSR
jgi:hypothetical protein